MRVLYISYDGLLDPLGHSQIIPYLKGISSYAKTVNVISFEKSWFEDDEIANLRDDLSLLNIAWHPLKFTSGMGAIGKVWDLLKLFTCSIYISISKSIHIIHARGHVSAQPAFLLKKIFSKKIIFDFRGLWVDERVDKGGWDLSKAMHRTQYKLFKFQERLILQASDQIVVLTKKALNEIINIASVGKERITVIPCCADFEHFSLQSPEKLKISRNYLGIPIDSFVFGYIGSLGEMYITESLLRLFTLSHQLGRPFYKSSQLLLITRDITLAKKLIFEHVPEPLHRHITIRSSSRDEIPMLIHAMNISVSFITATYARLGSSPTKIGECLATGVPVIVNAGIGDLENQINELKAGFILDKINDKSLKLVLEKIESYDFSVGKKLRDESKNIFGLDYAHFKYKNVYSRIINK